MKTTRFWFSAAVTTLCSNAFTLPNLDSRVLSFPESDDWEGRNGDCEKKVSEFPSELSITFYLDSIFHESLDQNWARSIGD